MREGNYAYTVVMKVFHAATSAAAVDIRRTGSLTLRNTVLL